jgi:hypothetical protein
VAGPIKKNGLELVYDRKRRAVLTDVDADLPSRLTPYLAKRGAKTAAEADPYRVEATRPERLFARPPKVAPEERQLDDDLVVLVWGMRFRVGFQQDPAI